MKTTYRTKQQDELLEYLRQNPGVHQTAAQIKQHFLSRQKNIGTSTIYRQLEKFVEDGRVKKYLLDTGDSACYEYVGEEKAPAHFHCKCEVCGRLIHLDCDEMQEMEKHLLEHHGFLWHAGKTVFYGVCQDCQRK